MAASNVSSAASQCWMRRPSRLGGNSCERVARQATLPAGQSPSSSPLPGEACEPQPASNAMAREKAEWQGARIDTGLRYQVEYWVEMGMIGLVLMRPRKRVLGRPAKGRDTMTHSSRVPCQRVGSGAPRDRAGSEELVRLTRCIACKACKSSFPWPRSCHCNLDPNGTSSRGKER